MKLLRVLIAIVGLALTTGGWALGLGKLASESGLNEPFQARIPLIGSGPDFADRVSVLLADAEQFNKAGIARSQILTSLRFEVVEDEESTPKYIRVTSQQPIREPFLNFVVEVSSPDGRLLQEFTVLLTPGSAESSGIAVPAVAAL